MQRIALALGFSSCKVTYIKYDNLLDGHANLRATLKSPPRRMSTCVHYLLLMVIIIYCRVPSPVLRKESHTT